MYNTRTILCGHIVTRNHTERLVRCIFPITFFIHTHRLHPWQELFVLHSHKVSTLVFANHLEGDKFVSGLIIFERQFCHLRIEVHIHQCLGQYHGHLLARVGVIGLHRHIINLGAHTKCHV